MPKHSLVFEALGTQWSIETIAALPETLIQHIHARIATFDATYSRFRSDSLIANIAKKEGSFVFPDDADALFIFYRQLYDVTEGKVTPLIGEMLERAGYDAHYSFVPGMQSPLPHWYDVLQWRRPILTTTQSVVLDVGAAGKGYLVDIVCRLLDDAGVNEYVVDASGDLRHRGVRHNMVGLEDPRDPSKVIGVIDIMNKSLCASASHRRTWGNGFHHIFDPDKAAPATNIIATWVVADEGLVADGLATALFFVDPPALARDFSFDYVRMYADGAIDYSYGFEARLY